MPDQNTWEDCIFHWQDGERIAAETRDGQRYILKPAKFENRIKLLGLDKVQALAK